MPLKSTKATSPEDEKTMKTHSPTQNEQTKLSRALQEAMRLQQQGVLDQAELSYRAILKAQPNHFDALHFLAILRFQQGRYTEALDLVHAALKLDPRAAPAQSNLGLILRKSGRLEEALASFDKALALQPNHVDALNNRGGVLQELGRLDEALTHFDKALVSRPGYAEAHYNRGGALQKLARLDEALASYDRALALRPDYVDALINRGGVLKELGRLDEALASYDEAVALRPDRAEARYNRGGALQGLGRLEEALASYEEALAIKADHVEALVNRGVALRELKRPDEALASFDKALALEPNDAEAQNNRGVALKELGRAEEELACYDRALALNPNYAEAHNNRGSALLFLHRPEEALASFDAALAIRPDYVEALNNRGLALLDLKRVNEALACCEKALALDPDYVEALYNRGWVALLMGDFPRGWKGYEFRWVKKDAPPREIIPPFPQWKGEDLHCKRILVYDEQGAGDVFQFSRFLTEICALGACVVFQLRPALHRLLQAFAGMIRFVSTVPPGEDFDFQCALLSLPAVLETTLDSVPASASYLAAESSRAAHWRRRLGDHGFKIGICWQGNPKNKIDIGRSIPLRCFEPMAAVPGVRLISLQKTYGVDQLSDLPPHMTVETLGVDFDAGPDAFLDSAAVMSCLDLIVTSDTSIAHLAGALGRPVWVALKHVPDWRWMLDRGDSPWYPTMKLYRQNKRDAWDEVFAAIAQDVARLSQSSEAPSLELIPVSIGELYDKITILEIKAQRISDDGKLQNIRRELGLLRELERRHSPNPEQRSLIAELKRLNEAIWDSEEGVRDCEKRDDFGDEFIAMARSIYKLNDLRAATKRRLNMLKKSGIVEEKSHETGLCCMCLDVEAASLMPLERISHARVRSSS